MAFHTFMHNRQAKKPEKTKIPLGDIESPADTREFFTVAEKHNSEPKIQSPQDQKPETTQVSALREELLLHKDFNSKLSQELHATVTQYQAASQELIRKEADLEAAQQKIEAQQDLLQSFKQSANNSPAQLVQTIAKLKAKLESLKSAQTKTASLSIHNVHLERELSQLTELLKEKSQLINAQAGKIEDLQTLLKSTQNSYNKRSIDLQMALQMNAALQSQKDLAQNSLKAEKQRTGALEKRVSKHQAKIESLRSEIGCKMALANQLTESINATKRTVSDQYGRFNEQVTKTTDELSFILRQVGQKVLSIEKALKRLNQQRMQKKDVEAIQLENALLKSFKEQMQAEHSKAAKTIDILKEKQANARAEILRLHQKAKNRDMAYSAPSQRLSLQVLTDAAPLDALRRELEAVYKSLLMGLTIDQSKVLFDLDDFGKFEKKFTSIFEQVQEAAEGARLITSRSAQALPKSLFACIASTDGDAIRTIKKRRKHAIKDY